MYIDDILITGKTEGAHLAVLEEVLKRLSNAGLRLKRTECIFLAPSVDYLGYLVDAQGTHPTAEKVKAIQEAPRPANVSELKSYLGLLTYYSQFLPNLSTTLAPLYKLLKHGVKWQWSDEQEKSFKESKVVVVSTSFISTRHSIFDSLVTPQPTESVRCCPTKCWMDRRNLLDLSHVRCLTQRKSILKRDWRVYLA